MINLDEPNIFRQKKVTESRHFCHKREQVPKFSKKNEASSTKGENNGLWNSSVVVPQEETEFYRAKGSTYQFDFCGKDEKTMVLSRSVRLPKIKRRGH